MMRRIEGPHTKDPYEDLLVGVAIGAGSVILETFAATACFFARGTHYATLSMIAIGIMSAIIWTIMRRRSADYATGFACGSVVAMIGLHSCLVNATSPNWAP